MQLIVGLGNPGKIYQYTRHNAGFWFLDALAAQLGLGFYEEKKYQAHLAKGTYQGAALYLLKPQTFMNRSGLSVAAIANFYQMPAEQILVAHDELDLAVGQVKIKKGGGNAGHNGLKDIQAQLGTPDFWRLRLGIGHPRDSDTPLQPVFDYVLKPPHDTDLTRLERVNTHVLNASSELFKHEMVKATALIHQALKT